MKKNNVIEILGNDVKYSLDNPKVNISDADEQFLEEQISKGYTSGQLVVNYGKNGSKETLGWWEIIKWKDIALQLYNAIHNTRKEAKEKYITEAVKRFDENWN